MSEKNNIPKHWNLVRVGEYVISVKGKKPKHISSVKTDEYSIPYVNIKAFEKNVIDEYTEGTGCVLCEEGDFLMVWDGSRSGYVGKAIKGALGSTLVKLNFPNIDNNYAYYFLQSKYIELNTRAKGVGIPHVDPNILWNYYLPIPPLPEQQAIVAKIEELLSDLENGKQQLLTAQQQLKVYRQSLLKFAFEGKLTKSWRESKSDLPTADDLLIQIENGKERFYQNQLKEWETELKLWIKNGQVGKKPSKPKVPTIPDKPSVQQTEKKWDIPKNWIWTQLGSLCFVTKLAGFEYTDYVKYDDNGDLPVLKAENVGHLGFKETLYSKVKTESIKMLTRSQLFGGELIIVFVGAGTGNVAMVPFNHKYFLGPNIGMARPYFIINSKYLELFYQSIFGKNLMLSAVKAVAQPSLSMGTIRQTPLAFPSIEEQYQIVSELESKLTVCDKIEETISQSLLQAETLRQSILKRAFEGRLVNN
jgi:type I restriction enzyme S subunit